MKVTFGDFLAWLAREYPAPPTVAELTIPDATAVLAEGIAEKVLLRFFSDFELLSVSDRPLPNTPSAFLYGRPPEWAEIDQHYDIERDDNRAVADLVVKTAGDRRRPALTVIFDDAGTGKTTVVKRVAHDYASAGKPVFAARTLSRIDVDAAVKCLSRVTTDTLVVIDGIADHIDQAGEILDSDEVSDRVTILGAERIYRKEYVDVVMGEDARQTHRLRELTVGEYRQLIGRYRGFGLLGTREAILRPEQFAAKLKGDHVAVAVCRILNDFKPFDRICDSLWSDAKEDHRLPYLCVALAQHCHRSGIRYSILQAIAGPHVPVGDLIGAGVPLPLTMHESQADFVIPANPVVAERILQRAIANEGSLLMEAFRRVARAIAPHVNRRAIMRRSPEARLAVRLFDADKIVKPLLGKRAEEFYIGVKGEWEWNSRYWEQRASLAVSMDISTAIAHAPYAVAIEHHTFPMTTLAKVLLRAMEDRSAERNTLYAEAVGWLEQAIDTEVRRSRVSIHPYTVLLNGSARFLELRGILTAEQRDSLLDRANDAAEIFPGDVAIRDALLRLRQWLPGAGGLVTLQ